MNYIHIFTHITGGQNLWRFISHISYEDAVVYTRVFILFAGERDGGLAARVIERFVCDRCSEQEQRVAAPMELLSAARLPHRRAARRRVRGLHELVHRHVPTDERLRLRRQRGLRLPRPLRSAYSWICCQQRAPSRRWLKITFKHSIYPINNKNWNFFNHIQ